MKKSILLLSCLVMMMMMMSGCSTGAGTFAGGAAAGAALRNTFTGAKADLQAKQDRLLEEQAMIVAKLAASNDEAEKALLEAQNAALKKKIETVEIGKSGITLTEKAVNTDWTDPDQSAPWVLSAGSLLLAYILNKKKITLASGVKALSEGIEKYKAQAQPAEAEKLYADVAERKLKNGVK